MARRDTKLAPGELGDLPELTLAEQGQLELENGVVQFNRMLEMIRESIDPDTTFKLRPSTISELNAIAVRGLEPTPGAFRTAGVVIEGSKHTPPPWDTVPRLVDDMCDYVNDNWSTRSSLHLAAYCMWRVNWIHPFFNGNGRTSRAISYLVLCAHTKSLLPGKPTIPEMIAGSKTRYYKALAHADGILLRKKVVDVSKMEELLAGYLATQLLAAVKLAGGQIPEDATAGVAR